MPEVNQNVEIYRGDSAVLRMPIVDDDDAPFALSGATVRWWLAKDFKSTGSAVLLKKSTETDEGVVIIPPNIIEVSLTASETSALAAGRYYHETKVFKDGRVATAATGSFEVKHALAMTP